MLRDGASGRGRRPGRNAVPSSAPVVDVQFSIDGLDLELFSVVSAIGTPADVTAEELRVEAFFPSSGASRSAWLEPFAL